MYTGSAHEDGKDKTKMRALTLIPQRSGLRNVLPFRDRELLQCLGDLHVAIITLKPATNLTGDWGVGSRRMLEAGKHDCLGKAMMLDCASGPGKYRQSAEHTSGCQSGVSYKWEAHLHSLPQF